MVLAGLRLYRAAYSGHKQQVLRLWPVKSLCHYMCSSYRYMSDSIYMYTYIYMYMYICIHVHGRLLSTCSIDEPSQSTPGPTGGTHVLFLDDVP